MQTERTFSEVALTYNANIYNLDEAKSVFQREINSFSSEIGSHLNDVLKRPVEDGKIQKVRWDGPFEESTSRNGPWLNYNMSAILQMDVKPPSYKIYRKAAAFLYFEIKFDNEFSRFMFRCRLENQNSASDNIDEKIMELISRKEADKFPNAVHQKSNTVILFRHEIENGLFDNLYQIVDSAISVCEEAIEEIFPDNEYVINDNDVEEFEE